MTTSKKYFLGDLYEPQQSYTYPPDMYTRGISVENHGNKIEMYGETQEEVDQLAEKLMEFLNNDSST